MGIKYPLLFFLASKCLDVGSSKAMSEACETIEFYVRMSSRLFRSKHSTLPCKSNSHRIIMGR